MANKDIALPEDFRLSLNHVGIELLSHKHHDDLVQVCQDGELWMLNYTSTPTPETVKDYIKLALNTPDRTAFAVIDEQTKQAIGTTSYHDILPTCRRLEIGYTWYAQSYQRTHVNTTCKLLLLSHAFESLGYHTVAFRTDALNIRSRQAILRLGAILDGTVTGNRLLKDGAISDTIFFKISMNEWQGIKADLNKKLLAYKNIESRR